MNLGIGTKVTIKDGSYMATQLKDGTISHSSEKIPTIGWNRDLWTILLRNVALPTMVDNDFISYHNNILIQNDVNGELWFCSRINVVEAGL
jgi:hypothetical protein